MCRRWFVLCCLVFLSVGVAVAQTGDGETPANEGICDELTDATPGLYGLCIAFCEAQDCEADPSLENPFENCKPASRRIYNNYYKKKTLADPDIPCLIAGEECPCFTQTELESLPPQDVTGQYFFCDGNPPLTSIIASFGPENFAQVDEGSDPPSCVFSLQLEGQPPILRNPELTEDEAAACRIMIADTIEVSPFCP